MFITGNDCNKRWKYIRDSYNKCKHKNKLPTGSSASFKTTKWMLYERLRFLKKKPTERASVATVEAEDTEGEETSTTGISEPRRRSEEISGEEKSNEEVISGGISVAGTSGTKRNADIRGERSGETSNEEASGPGKGTAETRGRKKKKTCQLDNSLHVTSLLQHWKDERDKQRQKQMKILTEEDGKADKYGINSFCSHIGIYLKKKYHRI